MSKKKWAMIMTVCIMATIAVTATAIPATYTLGVGISLPKASSVSPCVRIIATDKHGASVTGPLWDFGDGQTKAIMGTHDQVMATVTQKYTAKGMYFVAPTMTDGAPMTRDETRENPLTVAADLTKIQWTYAATEAEASAISPWEARGRPELLVEASTAAIAVDPVTEELWGVYYRDFGTGDWLFYIPGFASSTLTELLPGDLYLVVVSGACTLTIPQEPTPADGIMIEALLVTADHCYLKTYSWGYKVGKGQEYHIECVVADTSGGPSYEWSCTDGQIPEISQDGSIITWIAPDTSADVTVTVIVSDIVGNMVSESVLLEVVACSPCTFGCYE
jgi:hypothetical protein